jgi:hypothetical protein
VGEESLEEYVERLRDTYAGLPSGKTESTDAAMARVVSGQPTREDFTLLGNFSFQGFCDNLDRDDEPTSIGLIFDDLMFLVDVVSLGYGLGFGSGD